MIRVLDIPGVAAIENRVRLNAVTATRQDFELERWVETLIRETLGIEGGPTELLWEHDYYSVSDAVDTALSATAENNREPSRIELWRADGWDITGDDGKELLCLDLIEDALHCVCEGIAGIAKVELEAMLWSARKAAEASPVPSDRARNQAFLKFGGRRRKTH